MKTSPRIPRHLWILLALLLLTFGVRVFHLDYRGLWLDEFKTLASVRMPVGELCVERMSNGHFPTYFLITKAWRVLAGEGERALRFPGVLMGTLALVYVFLFTRRWWGLRAAVFCCLLYAFQARSIWAAQEARPYAGLLLAGAASMHALALGLAGGKQRWWWLYGFWSLLGLTLHGTYPFIFMSQAVASVVWMIRRRRWPCAWFVTHAVLLAATVAAYKTLSAFQTNDFMETSRCWPSPDRWRESLLQVFWGEYTPVLNSGFKYVGVPLAAAFLFFAWRCREMEQTGPHEPLPAGQVFPPALGLAAGWALSTFVGMNLFSIVVQDIEPGYRYYAVACGGAVLLMGYVMDRIPWRWWRWGMTASGMVLTLILGHGFLYSEGEQVREAIEFVRDHRRPGEPVVAMDRADDRLMLGYYGLKLDPVPVPRGDDVSTQTLTALLDGSLTGRDGFWMMMYKQKSNPIGEVLPRWAETHGYERLEKVRYREAYVKHYRRKDLAGDQTQAEH